MKNIIVTNNEKVRDKFQKDFDIHFVDDVSTYKAVLVHVRDLIHEGHILLTHPLSGSIKPNETPYKSIIISGAKEEGIDKQSLYILEEAQQAIDKFQGNMKTPLWIPRVVEDFKVIDLSLMEHTIEKLGHY